MSSLCCGRNQKERDFERCLQEIMNESPSNERRCRAKENNIVLSANTGGVGPLPVLTTPLIKDLPVASVTIDTSKLKDPSVLLTFTSQINMTAELNVNLVFTVKKYVENGSEQTVGGSWVFSSIAEILEAETFAFQFYEGNSNPGKFTYTVQVSSNSFVGVAAGLSITNATLSILAVDEI
ncbi:hypothetical protein UT300005_07690 [Clostridium sp. CTA-5]